MTTESFIFYYERLLDDIAAFCARVEPFGPDRFSAFFILRLEMAAISLASIIHGKKTVFGHADLPFLLYISWLVSKLIKQVKNKKKSKKAVSGWLLSAIRQAHQAQHKHWGDRKWPKDPPNINTISLELIRGICAREYQEAASRTNVADIGLFLGSYSVCAGFLSGKGPCEIADIAVNRASPPDPYQNYVTELPRRECPECGRSSYPVIAREMAFDAECGFYMQCQFCGHVYGKAGRKKNLYRDGKRVASTAWTTDKFDVGACQFCGRAPNAFEEGGLQAHHIVPVSEGGPDIPSNIMVLCPDCHAEAHRRREQRKAAEQEKSPDKSGPDDDAAIL